MLFNGIWKNLTQASDSIFQQDHHLRQVHLHHLPVSNRHNMGMRSENIREYFHCLKNIPFKILTPFLGFRNRKNRIGLRTRFIMAWELSRGNHYWIILVNLWFHLVPVPSHPHFYHPSYLYPWTNVRKDYGLEPSIKTKNKNMNISVSHHIHISNPISSNLIIIVCKL